MAVNGVLHKLRHHAKLMANRSNNQHKIGNVDSKGAIHVASSANVAFRLGNPGTLFDEVGIHVSFPLEYLPESLFDLAHRRKPGIPII